MVDISKVVTPGEFMLQAAAVRGDASAAIGRGMMVGAQQKENQQRMELLRQQMAAKQNAMNGFAEWQNRLQSIKDPIERMRALGTVPISTLADSDVSQAYSGIVNQTRAEYELSQKADEASGLADERRFRGEMLRLGVPSNAQPGDPIYEKGVELHRQRRALSIAAELGLTPDQVMTDQLPTLANGRLDEELFKASATFASPTQREKGMTANMKDAAYLTRLEERVASLPEGSPERAAAQRELSNFQLTAAPAGTEIQTPEGMVIRTGVRSASGVPPRVLADATDRVNSQRKALDEIGSLRGTISPKTVGFFGLAGEYVLNRVLPQFGIKSFDPEIATTREKLVLLREGALRDVSDDKRFSNADRTAIETVFPKSGIFETAENAEEALAVLDKVFSKRVIWDLKAMDPTRVRLRWENLGTEAERWAAYKQGIGPDGQDVILRTKDDVEKFKQLYLNWKK